MADLTYTVPNKNGSYDGDMVVKDYTALTINTGDTVTVDQPCRGLWIYVQGDCTINGTLSMAGKGSGVDPASTGTAGGNVGSGGFKYGAYKTGGTDNLAAIDFAGALTGSSGDPGTIGNAPILASGSGYQTITIPRAGTAGGVALQSTSSVSGAGYAGVAGTNAGASDRASAGGGSGCSMWEAWGGGTDSAAYFAGGNGGAGCIWSGGGGGAGSNGGGTNSRSIGYPGVLAVGGNASTVYACSGSSGNPPGSSNGSGVAGASGTGGLLFLVVGGTLTIGASGSITANGITASRNPASGGGSYQLATGGASGGGSVNILYRTAYVNNGSVTANGGAGGLADSDHYTSRLSGAGGNGCVKVDQIN